MDLPQGGKASPELMKTLKKLLTQPDNRICADCGAPHPKWASTNIGVFICIKCSGIHRSLGVYISKVLSVTLDDWTDIQVQTMIEVGGNAAANSIYEAYIPSHYKRPQLDASVEEKTDFIRRKYENQEFLKPALRISASSSSFPSFSSNQSQSDQLLSLEQKPSLKNGYKSGHSGIGLVLRNSWRKKEAEEYDTQVGTVEFLGLLKVRVLKGIDLAVRDLRSSDPYVVLTIGQQKAKTCVINSNLNPVWNEEHTLSIPKRLLPLKLEVYDKDFFSADDAMGEAEVDLLPLVSAAKICEQIDDQDISMQIGKWLATSDTPLTKDSLIWYTEGHVKQEISLKLQKVECGELEIELEWVPLTK